MTSSSPKAALRRECAVRRAAAHGAWPQASEAIIHCFPKNFQPTPGEVVAGYMPIRDEIDPRPLLRALAQAGARLSLPVTPPKGSDLPLAFRLWREGDPLRRSAFGVAEPLAEAPAVTPALLLAPLLAFDRRGGRLGYGAGHYDRTLAELRAGGRVRAIGLAFAEQEVDETPRDPHDQPLDGVLTPHGFIAA